MKKIALLILYCFTACAFFQGNENVFLFWKPDVKLKWKDFQGHIKSEDDKAASASYLGFLHTIRKTNYPDSVIIDTRAYFNRNKSWVKVPDVSPPLLAHEQVHFDLAELYGRKFRKALTAMTFNAANLSRRLDSTYVFYLESSDSLHALYDIQTNHGLDKFYQETWTEFAKGNLLQMQSFDEALIKLYVPK
ncbi:MAG TPA: hypothetical protein VNZ86_07615 [Bacteroidia bacterium]|jgi:hypothetical protein|nr:hypothetical protein [Bacteroidia bacterium]